MELTLPTAIDQQQALRYLGMQHGADAMTQQLLNQAERELLTVARPRAVTVFAERSALAEYCTGQDIQKHLVGCDGCILLGCTLGAGVDTASRVACAKDMAYAVVLDAIASVLAEEMAEQAEQILRRQVQEKGRFLTGRFSPGYGDWPIAVQNELIRLLDAPRKIGLCATPSHLMVPRKSITAILGVANHPVTGQRAGCAHCTLRDKCNYRKEGKTCGNDI